jgi:hypothetical protein
LCDLLVVCDPHIIIFSEKTINWNKADVKIAWPRWTKRAIFAAATQLKGAERWISEFPDRIFLDKDCKERFPLGFPSPDRRRLHRVVVARGAAAACRSYHKGGSGTFMIAPHLMGKEHLNSSSAGFIPFAVGDIDPEGDFVRVFDEVALDVVMRELNTVTDFTEYLDKRAEFIRSGRLGIASGEEDLLAYYAVRINDSGQHDFTPPEGGRWSDIDKLVIDGGFLELKAEPQYIAKQDADRISYVWDNLIKAFTDPLLDGTSVVLPGHTFSLAHSEHAVRYMALENRFQRRNLGVAVWDALQKGREKDIFFRLVKGHPAKDETGFFIVTVKYADFMRASGYDDYRLFRTFVLTTYARAVLIKYPHLKRAIGMAMEPPPDHGEGSSEENIFLAQQEWSAEDRAEVKEHCEQLGIWGPLTETPFRASEFPKVKRVKRKPVGLGRNRKARRAAAAKARRKDR